MTTAFDTPIETAEGWLAGPLRAPAQMLAEQSYDGHKSIHDDSMADTLGFKGGPIEGPTHFSQFDPLAVEAFGMEWFRTGCISCHFRAMVVEGEKTRAFLKKLSDDFAEIRMEKEDRTEVLKGTASLAGAGRRSALRDRVETVSPPQPKIILRDVEVGMTIPRTSASMEMDQHMGDLYPFSLKEKLAKITEPSPLYTDGGDFGGPVIPMEMLSVLAHLACLQRWLMAVISSPCMTPASGPLRVAVRVVARPPSRRCAIVITATLRAMPKPTAIRPSSTRSGRSATRCLASSRIRVPWR